MRVLGHTSHVSSALWPHVVNGSCSEQHRWRAFLPSQEAELGITFLEAS